ncbi:MAG: flagellar basal body-associated FliL family protein [Candidatus Marinimicrobia bacterium]|nr:flagellar basal body-associated FliL family protein [Candidatus Neomarinimicrobiota bacterium]
MAKEEKKPKEKKQKSKRGAFIIIIAALIVSVGTVVFTKIVLWPKYQNIKARKNKVKVEEIVAQKKKDIGEIFEMEPFTINPLNSGGRRFAKIQLSLEAPNKEVLEELGKRNPQIQSILLKYFRSKTILELTSPTFTDSSSVILIKEINKVLSSGKVTNLFYQDLLIQ